MATHLLLSLLLILLSTICLGLHLDTFDSTVDPAKYALRRSLLAASTAPTLSPAPSPAAAAAHHRPKSHKARNGVAGFVSGVTTGVVAALLVCFLFRLTLSCIRGRFSGHNDPSIFFPLIKRTEDLAFLQDTDSLASLDIIGRGGCGEVYRKQIDGDPPRTFAIKKIQCGPELNKRTRDVWMRQVRSEILTVGRIRHRNLLPLVAHVPRPDCQFLLYEYMKNGSLHDAFTHEERQLDWLSRHKIALGIASGLEYLHHSHKPRIVHRDLKPGNILLDDDMEARIADFGMAKEIPDANTHMTTANVAGTIGYIAPEYYQTLKFTTKCDIYSFGVILGVLVMGKLPSDPFFQETQEVSLVKWLRNVTASEEPEVAIDPKLRGNGYEDQMLLVARIACFCSAENPKERPTSKEVRAMLSQITHQD